MSQTSSYDYVARASQYAGGLGGTETVAPSLMSAGARLATHDVLPHSIGTPSKPPGAAVRCSSNTTRAAAPQATSAYALVSFASIPGCPVRRAVASVHKAAKRCSWATRAPDARAGRASARRWRCSAAHPRRRTWVGLLAALLSGRRWPADRRRLGRVGRIRHRARAFRPRRRDELQHDLRDLIDEFSDSISPR